MGRLRISDLHVSRPNGAKSLPLNFGQRSRQQPSRCGEVCRPIYQNPVHAAVGSEYCERLHLRCEGWRSSALPAAGKCVAPPHEAIEREVALSDVLYPTSPAPPALKTRLAHEREGGAGILRHIRRCRESPGYEGSESTDSV